jgi:putative drug exporter of the RND superfamily
MTTTTKARPDTPAPVASWPRWVPPALVAVVFLLIAGPLASAGGKLGDVQRNDSTAYLPAGAEATKVLAATKRFTGIESTTAIMVYHRPAGIGVDDEKRITLVAIQLAERLSPHLAAPPMGPIVSDDSQAAEVIVSLIGSDPRRLRGDVDALRATAVNTPGLELHVAGPAAALTDLTEVFGEVDGVLLVVALGAVLLILILAYRSPVLPFVVLGVAGMALGLANGMAYLLAKQGLLTVSGDAQGILDVLVLGAGTDYALLLTARYRDELRRHRDRYRAMRLAWRGAAPPIVASGSTVILGLLCLLASDLGSTRGLGPVAALGIACALVSMLVLLPAVLVLVGRRAFWPFPPGYGSAPAGARGIWPRLAAGIGRRPRLVWVVTALALGGLALGAARLEAHGVPRTDSFRAPVDSTAGQDVISRHFSDASATPVLVVAAGDRVDAVVRTANEVPGVRKATAYVDPLEALDRHNAGQPPPPPKLVDGQVLVDVTIDAAPDSPRATGIVRQLRDRMRAIPARVGGYTATNLDLQLTAQRDRRVVIPLVLGLVLVVLALLLRAIVAPLLLVATVILSFAATLGVCGVAFRDVFGFAGADSSFPLFAFVFLVALGVDYNIFLMSRVREEVPRRGHRDGTLTALAATGGVVTSAGVVLAATFAALAVLPLLVLAELAFAVAFGVLLDALVVRTLLVPALTVDLGRAVWWPGPGPRSLSERLPASGCQRHADP